ncbi:MAG: hypothetical protein ACI4ES_14600 [Roseburia sp.]
MKYTHRKELLFPDFESKFVVTLGVVMWMVGIILTFNGFLVGLPIGALLGIIAFVSYRKEYLTGYKIAHNSRRKYMENGRKCVGTIVEAGKKVEDKYPTEYYRTEEVNHKFTLNNYWIRVKFVDPYTGKEVIGTAEHMSKSGKHKIGKEVDVYCLEKGAYYDTTKI